MIYKVTNKDTGRCFGELLIAGVRMVTGLNDFQVMAAVNKKTNSRWKIEIVG